LAGLSYSSRVVIPGEPKGVEEFRILQVENLYREGFEMSSTSAALRAPFARKDD
jgi:hypothetical protein